MIGAMATEIHFVPGSLVFTGGLENQYQGGPGLVGARAPGLTSLIINKMSWTPALASWGRLGHQAAMPRLS